MTTTMNTGAASLSDEQRTTIQHAADKLRTVWVNHTGDKESRELCHKLEALLATPTPQADADFKNFHRLLCERFGYEHDERDWRRDQLSLIEHIASRAAIAAGGAQEPIGHADVCPGSDGGFTMAVFKASDVPEGSPLYASPLPRVAATVMPDDTSAFKNFHRQLCERFGYVHDEKDWRRDQVSLIECIAKKLETVEKDSARYRRFRRWHPRLQTSYWTGKWWEPIYGEKMDVCVDWLDEVPQPTPHADQCDSAAPAASNGEKA